jgi:hypothetical protein
MAFEYTPAEELSQERFAIVAGKPAAFLFGAWGATHYRHFSSIENQPICQSTIYRLN